MFAAYRFRKTLRTLAQNVVRSVTPEKLSKSAANADFFGYPCQLLPARGKNSYICLPKNVEVFCERTYLFPQEDVLQRLFPQNKVYSLEKDIYIFGEADDCLVSETDEAQMEKYYLYLALYSVYRSEKSKRRKQLLFSPDFKAIKAEFAERKSVETADPDPCLPPLYRFPDDLIRALLEKKECVCFPQGGLWEGLLPVLTSCGVKKVILPLPGTSVYLPEYDLTVCYQEILPAEKKNPPSYTGYEPTKGSSEALPTGNVVFSRPPAPFLPLSRTQTVTSRNKTSSFSGRNGVFYSDDVPLTLVVNKDVPKKCGVMAHRQRTEGDTVFSEAHYYYREKTAQMRIASKGGALAALFYGEDFALAIKMPAEKIICHLPFSNEEYPANDGVYRAREAITIYGNDKKITLRSTGMECRKTGEYILFPLPNREILFTID